ncbi:MAG TPA: hypothetical protein VFJ61_13520 [Solirubrobacterales bacterium]|nr:hypothetical protein [Solirubrobacterales bacterium]
MVAAIGLRDPIGLAISWTAAAAAALIASICFFAHWSSNRGRKVTRVVIEERYEEGD